MALVNSGSGQTPDPLPDQVPALALPPNADGAASAAASGAAEGEAASGADVDIDALCELIDATGEGAKTPDSAGPADVDELLGCLAAGPSSPLLAAKRSRLGSSAASQDGSEAEADLPEPTMELPAEVEIMPYCMTAKFYLRCEIDLKKVAFGIRHAEYNPRKHGSITIRLLEPRATALVRASGACTITGAVDFDAMKASAKKIARLVQKCDHDEVKFASYEVVNILAKARLGFPVRLEALAAKWRRNAFYEPEFYCGCVFRTSKPRCSYLLTSGGVIMLSGLRTVEAVHDAVKRIYSVVHEFQT